MTEILAERHAHVWVPQPECWYVEPPWCSNRLFDVEVFIQEVIDPCCGGGNIVRAAREHHLPTVGWDLVDRGFPGTVVRDFLTYSGPAPRNLVFNPPFGIARAFIEHAVKIARHKIAALFPVARLNAAQWLRQLPLSRVWLLSPRPSMPPGEYLARGEKPQGGRVDFAWLVMVRGFSGSPELRWLHRDEGNHR
jgi:hypothetical protein